MGRASVLSSRVRNPRACLTSPAGCLTDVSSLPSLSLNKATFVLCAPPPFQVQPFSCVLSLSKWYPFSAIPWIRKQGITLDVYLFFIPFFQLSLLLSESTLDLPISSFHWCNLNSHHSDLLPGSGSALTDSHWATYVYSCHHTAAKVNS